MSEIPRFLSAPLIAVSFAFCAMGFAATALAQHSPNPHAYSGGGHSARMETEHEHMARKRHHLEHERQARDHALSHGDYRSAREIQQHMNRKRHHLRHEQQEHERH